jgi:magnesium-transporting ATPase (P-type)
MMSEEKLNDIFSQMEDDTIIKARKKALLKINTARVIFAFWTLIIAFVSLWLFIPFLVLFLCSLKWPFLSLLVISIICSLSLVYTTTQIIDMVTHWQDVELYSRLGQLTGNVIAIFLIYLIIRGTIAAKKYNKLSKS